MQLHLENQTAVVIGGASGIGLAIAQEFAREGCRIAILDRSEHTASQAQQILARSASEGWPSSTSIGLRADVTDYSAIQTAARQIEWTLKKVGSDWKVTDISSATSDWKLSEFDCN